MIPTDHIYQAPMWALEQEAEKAAEEAERWAWHAQHECTRTDVAITIIDNATFTEPCCPACWAKVWKPEGATLLHQLHINPRKVAA